MAINNAPEVGAQEEQEFLFDAPLEDLLKMERGESEDEQVMQRRLFVPADSSTAAMVKAVADNHGFGIIMEEEADTLTRTLGQKWAGHEDLFRKFHAEEEVSVQRVDGGYRVVERPYVAIVLSGTPGAFERLLPSSEGGLYPRFCVHGYLPESPTKWNDVSPYSDLPDLDEVLEKGGGMARRVWVDLSSRTSSLVIQLQPQHWKELNNAFQELKLKVFKQLGFDGNSLVHRAGIHVFRLAMVLAVWEAWEGGERLADVTTITVTDAAFDAALTLGIHYAHTGAMLLQSLHKKPHPELTEKDVELLGRLPDEFPTQQFLEMGQEVLGKTERTVYRRLEKWQKLGLVVKVDEALFRKP